ncbi:hypothetical protein BOX15_Mlig029735g1, partial [Macrostomum lignano]
SELQSAASQHHLISLALTTCCMCNRILQQLGIKLQQQHKPVKQISLCREDQQRNMNPATSSCECEHFQEAVRKFRRVREGKVAAAQSAAAKSEPPESSSPSAENQHNEKQPAAAQPKPLFNYPSLCDESKPERLPSLENHVMRGAQARTASGSD